MVLQNHFFSLEQVIECQPLTVALETPLTEVISLMQEWGNSCNIKELASTTESIVRTNNSCVLVVQNNRLKGIFTERDLVKLIAAEFHTDVTIAEVMTRDVVTLTVTDSTDVFTALNLLRQHHIRHLPVIDRQDNLIGLVTAKNLRQKLQPINLMKWRKVSEIMETRVIYASPAATIRQIARLMADNEVSCIAIAQPLQNSDSNSVRPVGIITERDLLQFQNLNLDLEQPAHKVMSAPLFLVNAEDTLWLVQQQMQQRQVRRLLVGGAGGELKGIVTQTSLLKIFDSVEMHEVIETLKAQVCRLEIEKTRLLENRSIELEQKIAKRTTALKSANQRLQQEINLRRESERRFDSILNSLQDLVWAIDPDTFEVLYINPVVENIYGRPPKEFYANSNLWFEVIHPADRDRLSGFYRRLLAEGSQDARYRIVRPDGSIRYLLDRFKVIYNSEGLPIRLDGITTDITQRKRREEILRDIASGVSVEVGANFFSSLVQYLSKTLQVDYAFVGKVIEPETNSIETIVVHSSGKTLDNFRYNLADTPCGNTVNRGLCIYPQRVRELFPNLAFLKKMAAESYAEMQIINTAGILGVIAIVHSRAIEDVSLVEEVLKIFANRASAELERQQAQTALKESQERYALAVAGSSNGLWDWNIVTNEIFYALRFKEILGYSDEEFPNTFEAWSSKLHPEDCDRVLVAVRNHLNDRVPYNIEYRLQKKQGEYCWIQARGQAIWDEEGQAVRMAGSIADISDRKRREAIVKDIALGMSVKTGANFLTSLVRYLNKALKVDYAFVGELIQPAAEQIQTLAVYGRGEVISNFTYDLANGPCGNVIDRGLCVYPAAVRKIFPHIPPLETMEAESYAGMPIFDSEGRVIGLIAVVDRQPFDNLVLIEEVLSIFATRATVELELQQTEHKLRHQAALLDIVNEAIMVRGLDERVLFWNRGAEKLYGWTQAEALNKNARKLLDRESTAKLAQIQQIVRERGEWLGEIDRVTSTGKKIAVQSHWTLVKDEAGKPQSYLIVNTDITEQKQLKEQFLRTQRLESLGTLAGGIAHDLNNIFSPIMGFANLLPNNLPHVDEQTRHYFQIIETNARRGTDLVKQILTFARGLEGDRGTLQIRHIVTEIVQMIRETFPKNIELEVNIAKNIKTVEGDATQIHQVLMNLVVNARDAMNHGGKLKIVVENFPIGSEFARMHLDAREGNYVLVTVVDTGEGIPPVILDRIFEPFFTTKEVGRGTGLGLSTAIGIIKSHDGFIDVDSEIGKGTQFKVFLPASEAATTVLPAETAPPQGNGELILVVDDESQIREVTKAILETFNYQVLTAKDGIDAIALYAQHRQEIALIIIDMMMPSMDGNTAIRTLKQIEPQVKAIAVSGLIPNRQTLTELNGKFTTFMSKPYSNDDLLKTVHRLLNNHRI